MAAGAAEAAGAPWLQEGLEAALGGPVAVAGVTTLGGAPDAPVLAVALVDGTRLLVKRTPRGSDLSAARTAAVLRLAHEAGVPVPSVLGLAAEPDGGGLLVLEHLDGVPWQDARDGLDDADLERVQRDLAGVLLALRTVRFAGFGPIADDARVDHGQDLPAALAGRAGRIADPADRTAFLRLLEREAALFADPPPAVLVHDDLHPGNLLLRRDAHGRRLAGVLDWDKAWAGPADADVARLAFWDGMTGPAFWTALGEPPLAAGAARRRLVLQLLWALEYADPSPRHRAGTADLRHRLGLG